MSKNKYAVEKEKRKWWIWGERENSNANSGKENGITSGLPPSESFTFIVCKQDYLHTFED
jgi:hypothetical protein